MDGLKRMSEQEPMERSIEDVAAGRECIRQTSEDELILQPIEAGLITPV